MTSAPTTTTAHPARVTLVIPCRDGAEQLPQVLAAVQQLAAQPELESVLLIDDGSRDNTAEIARAHGVQVLQGPGRGPAGARNVGWRAATTPYVWFVDADCVVEPQSLNRLLEVVRSDPQVAGVGGSYANMRPHSLLACLIHEEIVARHRSMSPDVDFLATFNVLYRRDVLEAVGGFDESLRMAEDADLAFRIRQAGFRLRFEPHSRVAHFHPHRLRSYLRTQRVTGYYRMLLYLKHPRRMPGDGYSGLLDHIQPPLGVALLAAAPLAWWPATRWIPLALAVALVVAQVPLTWRLVRQAGHLRFATFAMMGAVRALWRGLGMSRGVAAFWLAGARRNSVHYRTSPVQSMSEG